MEYEVKVSYTGYFVTEADSREEAIENAKQLVAEEFNGYMSDEAQYEIV